MKKIILVVGLPFSGKTTFAENHVLHDHIEVGDIVREITQTQERKHILSLDEQICKILTQKLLSSTNETGVVITGIRQMSILFYLIARFGDIEIVWLEVPKEELQRRYINRDDVKDKGLTFEEIIRKDYELGLAEIEFFCKNIQVRVVDNY